MLWLGVRSPSASSDPSVDALYCNSIGSMSGSASSNFCVQSVQKEAIAGGGTLGPCLDKRRTDGLYGLYDFSQVSRSASNETTPMVPTMIWTSL